jgi:hypothetical protein
VEVIGTSVGGLMVGNSVGYEVGCTVGVVVGCSVFVNFGSSIGVEIMVFMSEVAPLLAFLSAQSTPQVQGYIARGKFRCIRKDDMYAYVCMMRF